MTRKWKIIIIVAIILTSTQLAVSGYELIYSDGERRGIELQQATENQRRLNELERTLTLVRDIATHEAGANEQAAKSQMAAQITRAIAEYFDRKEIRNVVNSSRMQ